MKTLQATPTFLRDYQKAGPGLAHLAEQEVHFLLRRASSEPKTWIRRYDRVAGIAETVLELEVGGGPRMLVHVNGAVTLCRLGNHEVVRKTVANRALVKELDRAQPAPRQFLPENASRLFPPSSGGRADIYGAELVPDWVYWLDEEQVAVATAIVDDLEAALLLGKPVEHMVLGGPGTGKTTILLWLMQRLCAAAPDSNETWDVRLVASARLVEYVERSTKWNLKDVLRPVASGAPDIILVDDPLMLRSLPYSPNASRIVAVDPLQLASPAADGDLKKLRRRWKMHWLQSCYRQKEEVGLAARHVMEVVAHSSPFLVETKQKAFANDRREITRMSNAMSYPNPTGRVRTHPTATLAEWSEYVEWLKYSQRLGQMWSHWPSLLLVVDDDVKPPNGWVALLDGITMDRIRLSDLEKVKGLEYQHVILLLGQATYKNLNEGFTGSGKASYGRFVRMRIPFTRAKDSIATFVLPA